MGPGRELEVGGCGPGLGPVRGGQSWQEQLRNSGTAPAVGSPVQKGKNTSLFDT